MSINRRTFLAAGAASAAGAPAVIAANAQDATKEATSAAGAAAAGRVRQSVCKWCYRMELDELCRNAAAMGLSSVELLNEDEWSVPFEHGLTCAVANGPGPITRGWNDPSLHDGLVRESERLLPLVAARGIPNMIVFSGNRNGMADAEGLANCARGLKRIMPIAEKAGVTVIMELLNSAPGGHVDYMCDHTPWGVELVKQVGSDRFRLLYDIFHMQIMEGNIITTIQNNIDSIAHFHTGGVPGRREIDESQELFYPRIVQAIADAGFKGYLGQEFLPARDPMTSLREAVRLCTV
ncbi:MAG: hydroxypyruvate isomerase family protein [Phycisphaerales bacterium]